MSGEQLAAIELCDCVCHNGDSWDTPFRWDVISENKGVAVREALCTDCLLTLLTSEVGVQRVITRVR